MNPTSSPTDDRAGTAGPTSIPTTSRTTLTRMRERQVVDQASLYAILDEGIVAHVALSREWGPVVLPMLYARDGDSLLLHGSTGGGFFREAAGGTSVTVAVTHVDGLVFARSTFNSSMNYRSAMIVGTAVPIVDREEKRLALDLLSEHVMPGRNAEVRPTTAKERAATSVLRLPLAEASVKVRAAGPGDADEHSEDVWAGVVPLVVRALPAVTAPEFAVSSAEGRRTPASASAERLVATTDARRPAYR